MITKPLLIVIGVLTASLVLASYGLYRQVQANGELLEQIEQKNSAIAAHNVAWRFTDGVMAAQQKVENDAQTKLDSHSDDVGVADNAAERLRNKLEQLSRQSANDRAGFAEYRKTTEARIRMFTDMLKESDRLAGVYANQADRSRIAGEACEKSYDEIVTWIRKTYPAK